MLLHPLTRWSQAGAKGRKADMRDCTLHSLFVLLFLTVQIKTGMQLSGYSATTAYTRGYGHIELSGGAQPGVTVLRAYSMCLRPNFLTYERA